MTSVEPNLADQKRRIREAAGPSIQESTLLPRSDRQSWVTSFAIICEGTRRFVGAKGSLKCNGSAYFPNASDSSTHAGPPILKDEFDVSFSADLKLIPADYAVA